MALKTNTNTKSVGLVGGQFIITVNLISQNLVNNTSYLEAITRIKNTSNTKYTHSSQDIDCWLNGSGGFENGDDFGYELSPDETRTLMDRHFTVNHGNDGDLTATFTGHYGEPWTPLLSSFEEITANLSCPHISQPPSKPGTPSITSIGTTNVDLTWTAPTDHDVTAIKNYILRRYDGSVATGAHVDSSGLDRNRSITGLVPGATYAFTVVAYNSSQINGGGSDPSSTRVITMKPGPNVRVAGVWTKSTMFVRSGGTWKQGLPFVRSGGVWKQAK